MSETRAKETEEHIRRIERRVQSLQFALAALLERVRKDEPKPFEFEINELRRELW